MAGREFVHRPAAIILFGVANGAGFVNLFTGEADILWTELPVWKFGDLVVTSALPRFTPLLRRVVCSGQSA